MPAESANRWPLSFRASVTDAGQRPRNGKKSLINSGLACVPGSLPEIDLNERLAVAEKFPARATTSCHVGEDGYFCASSSTKNSEQPMSCCHCPRLLRFVMMVVVGLMLPSAAPTYANELPTRKAGLWELTTSMDEGRGPTQTAFKMCVEADMERNMVMASMIEHKSNCAKYEINRKDGAVHVESDCVFDRVKVTSHTVMTGDFAKNFGVQIESTTVPPDTRQTIAIKRTIKQSGTYVGAECGDLKPGEAVTSDGKKVLVQ